ncbi:MULTISPECIES: APC family permease [unclassified Rhodococcus (in: high G+C Gram-positive bacteria)]|uniref:APC family permease n=1 Tax=unclassified Rhodococcus (in: high G+C Gram-positive bacteria) TaxID=192944 RepID=UPI00163ABC2F|nr:MULTISPECIES: APC family permease [unclassified Rhodococcus (in: high G+C Gram-positive bacteria)]MBC2640826.1 APC family permease [Rhodococcus sp. 3A]MBC2894430.1 APC family permease [Rhodococcus sp. 4CII]
MSADELPVEYGAADKHLKRSIGLVGLIGLFVSIQVGSGWLLACLAAVSKAGPAAIISWIVGALFFAVIGVAWMELGTSIPRSGGGVRYPRMSHGAFLSWTNAWGYIISMIALPVIETMAVLTYLGGHWPQLGFLKEVDGQKMLAWPNGILAGFGVMLVFLALNLFGAKLLSESNKIVTVWKLVVPTITFLLMFTVFKIENFTQYGGFDPMGVGAIFGAVSGGGIVFAYAGIRQIIDFGGEVINPKRNIPIAMIVGGLIFPLTLYLCLQIAFIGAIDWQDAGVTPGDWAGMIESTWQASPLLDAVTAAGFAWFSLVLLSDAVLSPAAAGWVNLGIGGRIAYSMSVNGELPGEMQRINRWGVPWVALVTCTGIGFLLFLPVPSWYVFVGMVATAMVLNYLMAGPCVAVFRRVAPELPRALNIPFLKFWVVAGYVCSLLLIYFAGWSTLINVMTVVMFGLPIYLSYTSVRSGWTTKNISGALALGWTLAWVFVAFGGGWMFKAGKTTENHWPIGIYAAAFIGLIGVFIAAMWLISTEDGRHQITAGLWVFPALVFTTFIAYFGDEGPQPELTYGSDVLIVIVLGLVTYAWAVRSGYRTDELDQVVRQQLEMEEYERAAAHAA